MRDTNNRILRTVARGQPQPRPRAILNTNGIRRITLVTRAMKTGLIIFSHSLSPIRIQGLRGRVNVQIISHARLVLSVFTRHTGAKTNGLRMRLTRLRCRVPQLAKHKQTVSQLKNNVNAHNPNRAGLRARHHTVRQHVAGLRRRIGRLRTRHTHLHRHHRSSGLPSVTVINCAGTNGSALIGALAGTRICTTSRLFTALSPAAHHLSVASPSARRAARLILASAIKFVRRLPTSLVSTFHTALRRIARTSTLLRIISMSRPT